MSSLRADTLLSATFLWKFHIRLCSPVRQMIHSESPLQSLFMGKNSAVSSASLPFKMTDPWWKFFIDNGGMNLALKKHLLYYISFFSSFTHILMQHFLWCFRFLFILFWCHYGVCEKILQHAPGMACFMAFFIFHIYFSNNLKATSKSTCYKCNKINKYIIKGLYYPWLIIL